MIPVSFLQGNVVFDANGNPYAVYVVQSVAYAFQNTNVKISIIRKIASAFSKHTGKIYIYLLAKQYSSDQIAERMSKLSKTDGWGKQVKLTEEYLTKKMAFERVNYVVVPLKKVVATYFDQDKTQFLKDFVKNVWMGVVDATSKLTNPIFKNDLLFAESMLEKIQQLADDMLKNELSNFQRIQKASQHEVEWWLKKGYHRGLRDPDLQLPRVFPAHVTVEDGERKVLPIKNTLVTLSKLSQEQLGHIESHTDDGISYSSYMPILHVPPEIDDKNPTGYEWIYGPLERLSFPVDVALVINLESSTEAIKKLKRKRKMTLAQIKEWVSGKQDVPEEVVEDLQGIDSGLRNFREKKTPLLHMTAIIGLGAPTLEELRRRKKIVVNEMEQYDVVAANSPGDQKAMFQSFYPFAQISLPDRWAIQMEPGILAAAAPWGVRKLGDPYGFLFAELIANDRPVFMNPERPAKELQRANTILICGDPGSGKTTTGKHIAHNLIEWDATGYIEDPKGDYDVFAEHPTVKFKSRVISFAPRNSKANFDRVNFNIFRLAKEKTNRNNAASTILDLLLNSKSDETRSFVIDEAMYKVFDGNKWDMNEYTMRMKEIKNSHEDESYRIQAGYCLGHLKRLRENGIASLLFDEDSGEMIFDRNVLIAITRGLKIPDSKLKKEEWELEERVAAAIRYGTSTLALRHLMSLPRHMLKFQVFEEYWILKKFPGGKQLIEEALRFSRFENMLVILSTQNPTDSLEDDSADSDDINGLFSWRIMLRLESQDQIRAALKLLGMSDEDPEDWYTTFSVTYKNGRGIAKDPEGNIGEIQVKPVDEETMYYLKSTPSEEEAVSL